MEHIQLRHIIYAFMTLIALGATIISISKIRQTYKSEANQQRAFFKCFISSLSLYFFGGFFGGICVFNHDPLTAFCRVIAFTEIPTYSICFLLMSALYFFIILFNAIIHVTQIDEIKDPIPEEKGFRKIIWIIRRFFAANPNLAFFIAYTLVFILVFRCVFAVNIFHGKGLIWRTDGKPQYLPYMKYTGEYIQEMIRNFSQGNYTIKMYDFSIGMGEDVRCVLRLQPGDILAAFFNEHQLEKLYNLLSAFYFYLAGLTFSLYCRYRKVSRRSTLVAVFTYLFSGFGLNLASRHPSFCTPMILLPLLFLAIDRLIRKKGYLLFTLLVAWAISMSYYFLYMATIAMGFYALVRFVEEYHDKPKRLKEFALMMVRIIFFYLLGVGCSCIFFLPVILRTLSSERLGSVKTMVRSLTSYSDDQAIKIFASSVAGKITCYDIYLAFAVIFLPALVILFLRRIKDHLGLKILLIIEFVALSIPAAGLAMSAFSTVTNRWVYIVAFTAAYTIAVTLEDFSNINFLQFWGLLALIPLYAYACYHLYSRTDFQLDLKLSFILLVITVFMILFMKAIHYVTRNQMTVAMLLLSIISLTAHGCYLYGNEKAPFSEEFLKTGKEMNEFLTNEEFSKFENMNEEEDNTFYRFDLATQRDYYENMSIIHDYNSTSIYNSVINADVVNHMVDLGSIGISAVHRIYNLDGRTNLEELACVKYYEVEAGNNLGIPYGFMRNEKLSDENHWVYENKLPLPIGYTYTDTVEDDAYAALSPLEKEQVLMQSAVVDSKESGIKEAKTKTNLGEIIVRRPIISKMSSSLNSGKNYLEQIYTEGNDGFMMSYREKDEEKVPGFNITFHRKKGYEIYLKLEDLDTNQERVKLLVTNNRFHKMIIARSKSGTYSLARNDYYVNLGYSQGYGDETVRLSFCNTGDYTLKDMKLYYVPMDTYKKNVASLKEDSLENVVFGTNQLSGTVSAQKEEVMVFSIPYSTGWTAKIDGKEANLFHANTAYMGLRIPKGNHKITLSYETPGFRLGAIISVASLFLFFVVAVFRVVLFFTRKFGGKVEVED